MVQVTGFVTLLLPPPANVALFIDLFIFFSYIVVAIFVVYVAKNINYQNKLTLPWIILATGLLIISLNIFVEIVGGITGVYIIPRPILWYVFNTLGSIALIVGFAAIMSEKQLELTTLKKRQLEIKDIMQYLKEQYYKKEIGEGDLRRLYSDLVESLAEIEVKIRRFGKKK